MGDIPGYRSVAVAEWEFSPFEDYVLCLPPGCRRLQTFSRTWRPAPRVEWEHRIVLDVCTRAQVCSLCGLACLLLLPDVWWCSCCCQDPGFFAGRVPAVEVVSGSGVVYAAPRV